MPSPCSAGPDPCLFNYASGGVAAELKGLARQLFPSVSLVLTDKTLSLFSIRHWSTETARGNSKVEQVGPRKLVGPWKLARPCSTAGPLLQFPDCDSTCDMCVPNTYEGRGQGTALNIASDEVRYIQSGMAALDHISQSRSLELGLPQEPWVEALPRVEQVPPWLPGLSTVTSLRPVLWTVACLGCSHDAACGECD